MIELLSNPLVDFVSRVALPGLSVLVAILTLAVLLFTLRRVSLTLTPLCANIPETLRPLKLV